MSTLVQPTLSYPGVYLQEVDSQVLTIPPIPTSLTAFVGRTLMGPTNTPTLVQSMADFQTIFGGLWEKSPLSFSINDFFQNGGAQAYVVRLYVGPSDAAASKNTEAIDVGVDPKTINPDGVATIGLQDPPPVLDVSKKPAPKPLPPYKGDKPYITLRAASPGTWGNGLSVSVDQQGITDAVADSLGLTKADLFNLRVRQGGTVVASYTVVSLREDAGPNRLDRVLSQSLYVQWTFDPAAGKVNEWIGKWGAYAQALASSPTSKPGSLLPTGAGGSNGYYLNQPGYFTSPALQAAKPPRGLYALDQVPIFNLLVIPRDKPAADRADLPLTYADVFDYVVRRRAFWILDQPLAPTKSFDGAVINGLPGAEELINTAYDTPGENGRNAAVYYPDINNPNPLLNNRVQQFGPAGMVAGIYARTDATRGVWKAPAGQEAALQGSLGASYRLDDAHNGTANLVGINCLRNFPVVGPVVWGARTLRGATALNDPYMYVPVRRLTLFIEQSLLEGTRWAVFEPNDETLWSSLRLQVGSFLDGLYKDGAFMGAAQKDAYYVQCDASTTTPGDQIAGVVNIIVGIAPVRPAEFIVIYIQQIMQTGMSS